MTIHKAIGSSQVCKLRIQLSRHLIDHGALTMDYLIVRKHLNKVFTVCILQTKGQPSVIWSTEQRIHMHILQKVIHPAHIPFEQEA